MPTYQGMTDYLYERTQRDVGKLFRTDKAIRIVDMLFDAPVFRAAELHKKVGVKRQRAAEYIRELKNAAIITEVRPAIGQKSALVSFDALWKITDRQ